jgi:hypothetical protein
MTESDPKPGSEQVPSLTSLGETAVDLTLGVLAVGLAGLRAAPDLAAKLPALAQREVDQLLVRGAEVRSTLMGLLAGRLLGPPIVDDDQAEPDPFDSIFDDPDDEAFMDQPRVVPFVVVGEAEQDSDAPPPVAQADGLPIEEFDEISLGLLRVKARALSIADLELLLDHERTHGARPGVLSLLETRIAQLQQEQSAG